MITLLYLAYKYLMKYKLSNTKTLAVIEVYDDYAWFVIYPFL